MSLKYSASNIIALRLQISVPAGIEHGRHNATPITGIAGLIALKSRLFISATISCIESEPSYNFKLTFTIDSSSPQLEVIFVVIELGFKY